MLGRTAAGTSALVFVALLVSGCGGSAEAQAEPPTPPETIHTDASDDDAPENDAAADAAACAAVSDVMTIVENADVALREGRTAAQEQQGWYGLATRVLDRIPSDGDGAVSQGISELKAAAPAVRAGTGAEPVGVGSPAWHDALGTLADPCVAADAELAIGMFTGG